MMINKSFAALVVISTLTAAPAMAAEVYGGVNAIQGYTLGVSHNLSDTFGVRAEVNYLNYNRNMNIKDIDWDGSLKNHSLGLFADYHPFDGAFRLTGGTAIGQYKMNAHGTSSSGYYTINGTQYNASGEYINGSITSPSVRPYLGLGWGHTAKEGFGAYFDAGVFYGKLKYNIDASPTLTSVASSDIAAEQSDGQSTLDKYKFMPSIAFGVSYTF
jgi:hypothetical protein